MVRELDCTFLPTMHPVNDGLDIQMKVAQCRNERSSFCAQLMHLLIFRLLDDCWLYLRYLMLRCFQAVCAQRSDSVVTRITWMLLKGNDLCYVSCDYYAEMQRLISEKDQGLIGGNIWSALRAACLMKLLCWLRKPSLYQDVLIIIFVNVCVAD